MISALPFSRLNTRQNYKLNHPRLKARNYRTVSKLTLWFPEILKSSSSLPMSWCSIYSHMISSVMFLELATKYPLAHKCRPKTFLQRFESQAFSGNVLPLIICTRLSPRYRWNTHKQLDMIFSNMTLDYFISFALQIWRISSRSRPRQDPSRFACDISLSIPDGISNHIRYATSCDSVAFAN